MSITTTVIGDCGCCGLCSGLHNTGIIAVEEEGTGSGGCPRDGAWEGEANYITDKAHGNWIPNSSASRWIAPACDASAIHPEEDYEYTLRFRVHGDPERIKIVGRCAVDNLVLETRLNGEDVGFSLIGVPCDPENPAEFHTHWNEFEIIGGLQAGENELQFITQNTKGLCAHSFQAGWRCELVCVPYDPEEGTDNGD